MIDGGYEEGYAASPCFWGENASTMVKKFLLERNVRQKHILDLGCGEGKNANAFALSGAVVQAVDCSQKALKNGQDKFSPISISWHLSDACNWPFDKNSYDVVIMYGLLHCLDASESAADLICRTKEATKSQGFHIVCAFNDRSQDLSAHPQFKPILLKHQWFLSQYSDWTIVSESDEDLYETHPHNSIPHHHSLTRMIVQKP